MTENAITEKIDNGEVIEDERLKNCRIKPLGHHQGTYYFLSPVGELRSYKHSDFSVNGILSLFEGYDDWLVDTFPRLNKRGDVIGFSANDTAAFLITQCRMKGIYDTNIEIRGLGVWRSGEDTLDGKPQLIVHCGNVLFRGAEMLPAGQMIGNAIYPAAPYIPPLAHEPASADDGQKLLSVIKKWYFKREDIDPGLILGFIAQAMLGGAAYWRAHMMINGPAGSGKSWLAKLATGVLGGASHPPTNNFSEAGLRQAMTQQARCLVLDEAEQEEGGGRIHAVIELLRHMSGSDGARALRGSSGGQSQAFTVTGCALMFSILRVPLRPQDKSRITQINMQAPPTNVDPGTLTQLQSDINDMKALSTKFRARMVHKWELFLQNFDLYRTAFMESGLSSRGSDQMATLLAGRDTLCHDEPISGECLTQEIAMVADLIEEEKADKEDNEGEQCLNYLYSSMHDAFRAGEKETVGQLLIKALKEKDDSLNKQLGTIGIRIEYGSGAYNAVPLHMIVATKHVGLDKIYTGTRWAGGGWLGALEYLGGNKTGTKRFAGAASRGIVIHRDHFPKKEEDD